MLAAIALSAVITVALVQSADDYSVGGFVAFVTAMLMLIAPLRHLYRSCQARSPAAWRRWSAAWT